MQALVFLLDTLFGILVAAALLRAWMNAMRIRMSQQPGPFVMAATEWLVGPVRRTLPRHLAQANFDWGSVVSACLLAVVYAAAWHGLRGGALAGLQSLGWVVTLPLMALWFLVRTTLQGLMWLLLAYAILSWGQQGAPVFRVLAQLLEPMLSRVRAWVPRVGGVDLSVLVLLVLLQVALLLVV